MDRLKQAWMDLWGNKPLFFLVVAIFAYLIYRSHQAGSQMSPATTGTIPSGSTINYSVYSPQEEVHPPGGGPIPMPQPPVVTPPPVQPPVVMPPTTSTGLLGSNVAISKNAGIHNPSGGQYVFQAGPGAYGDLLGYLRAHTGIIGLQDSDIRGGSQGRWWYIWNNRKYLITSGSGGPITNDGTDANAK